MADHTAPAGWYPDPYEPGGWRYWDGRSWTPYIHHPWRLATIGREQGSSEEEALAPEGSLSAGVFTAALLTPSALLLAILIAVRAIG